MNKGPFQVTIKPPHYKKGTQWVSLHIPIQSAFSLYFVLFTGDRDNFMFDTVKEICHKKKLKCALDTWRASKEASLSFGNLIIISPGLHSKTDLITILFSVVYRLSSKFFVNTRHIFMASLVAWLKGGLAVCISIFSAKVQLCTD